MCCCRTFLTSAMGCIMLAATCWPRHACIFHEGIHQSDVGWKSIQAFYQLLRSDDAKKYGLDPDPKKYEFTKVGADVPQPGVWHSKNGSLLFKQGLSAIGVLIGIRGALVVASLRLRTPRHFSPHSCQLSRVLAGLVMMWW